MDFVMGFGPVTAHENGHRVPPRIGSTCEPAGFPSGDLMDQCSTDDSPSALAGQPEPADRGTS